MSIRNQIEKGLILLGVTGSRLYGTYTANSDYDYTGIFIPHYTDVFGLSHIDYYDFIHWRKEDQTLYRGQYNYLNELDFKHFALNKFIELALANNPNILELLYLPEYTVLTELGRRLVEYRSAFLSKKVYKAYSGYAYSQLKKVETHRKWLLAYANNPDAYSTRPSISDYIGEEFTTVLSKDELNAYHYFLYTLLKEYSHLSLIAEQVFEEANLKNHLQRFAWPAELDNQVQYYTKASNDFTTLVRKTHNYKAALRDYTNYHSWKENRNSKRGLIESQCGYDGHHLHHCIRLMQMGKEILTEETLFVDRTDIDASFLLEIKQGRLSYEEIITLVEELKIELEEAYRHTCLPDMANRILIEELVIDLNKSHLLSSIRG